jgi:hypothetical protein
MIYGTTNTMSSTNLHSSEIKIATGTNQTVTIRDMKPAVWTFAATAVKESYSVDMSKLSINLASNAPVVITNKIESDPSNFLVIEMPQTPAMMRTLVIQANATLAGTNWIDAGFFKLKIQ